MTAPEHAPEPDAGEALGALGVVGEAIVKAYKDGHAQGRASARNFPEIAIYLWLCPWCKGGDEPCDQSPAGCFHCGGLGMTNDVGGWDPSELTRAPLPAALMPAPCGECAFRPNSPEADAADFGSVKLPGRESPFFCHTNMIGDNQRGYSSPAWIGELPLGAFLCRGWWNTAVEGQDAPARPYKDVHAARAARPEEPTRP